MNLRALVADDHDAFRRALRRLLEAERDVGDVAEARDGAEALVLASEFAPDLVCMDMRMPKLDGVEATRQLIAARPQVKVVGLSECADRASIAMMLNAGALGYVTKFEAVAELLKAIRAVFADQAYLSASATAAFLNDLTYARERWVPALTPWQRRLLELLAAGDTPEQIAEHLHLERIGVEAHCENLLRRLKAGNIAELSRYAQETGHGAAA